MATVTTDRSINLSQLSTELSAPLSARGAAGRLEVECHSESVTQQQLADAVASHVPDPDFGKSGQQRELERVIAWAERAFADPANNRLTVDQSTRLLAALVLRATR